MAPPGGRRGATRWRTAATNTVCFSDDNRRTYNTMFIFSSEIPLLQMITHVSKLKHLRVCDSARVSQQHTLGLGHLRKFAQISS